MLDEELVCFGPTQALPGVELPKTNRMISYDLIANLPLILPGGRHGFRDLLERQAAASGATLNTVIEVDSLSNIKDLVRCGLGYSILSMNAISYELKAGQLKSWNIGKPPIKRPIYLAHSIKRPITNAVSAIKRLALEVMRDLVRRGNLVRTTIIDQVTT